MPPPPPPRPHLIETDLPCLSCGYNLRTLPAGAVCPECGTPVSESVRGDGLSDGTPARLHRLRRGATLAVTFIAIALTFEVINLLAPWTFANRGWRTYRAVRITSVWLIGPLLECAAILLLTSRVTDAVRPDPAWRLRFALRVVTAVSTLMACAAGLTYLFASGAYAPAFVRALLDVPQISLAFVLLRALARRLPDDRMARHAATLAVACGVCAVILFAANFGVDFLNSPTTRPPFWTVTLPIRALALGCAIAAAAYLLTFRARITALSRAAAVRHEAP